MPNSFSKPPQPSLVLRIEDALEARYSQLQQWALMLTRGDVGRAEDIVHDLYVSMSLTKPDLGRIENVDNYLYKSLRHIYLSQLARSSREALQSATVAEFDSIQIALWVQNDGDLLQQQNDLRRICNYAVWRKGNFKGASYFVLRFYHGYHLDEIAALAGLPLSAIQAKLSQARSEVQTYMQEPAKLKLQSSRSAMPEPTLQWNAVSSPELVRELRATILNARTGECLPEEELLAHYGSPTRAISSALLAHVVSCEHCLSAIDHHFRRPTLKDREPLFHGQAGNGGGKKVSAKTDASRKALQKSVRRLLDEIYQHRPRRLSIAVDGKIIASHDVRARQSTLLARIDRPENANFIEVFSEQQLRIAFLPLGELPPDGPHEMTQQVHLSDDRWMTLTLTFDGLGLNGEVTYFDPSLPSEAVGYLQEDEQAVVVIRQPSLEQDTPHKTSAIQVHDKQQREQSAAGLSLTGRLSKLWSRVSSSLSQMPLPEMNPTLATAMVLAVASFLCFFLWLRQPPRMTANALLIRAEAWDSTQHAAPGIVYQKVRIKTARRTLDRAIYRDAQGVRTPRRQKLATEDEQLKNELAVAGINWDEPLSATAYQDWHDHQHERQDQVTRAGDHLLKLTTTVTDGAVSQTSLTVRDTDFHPVARTVQLRGAETVEVAELNYDVMPWSAGAGEWFEPVSLSPIVPGHVRPALSLHLPVQLTDMELDQVELSVRLALNRLGADNGERIELIRNPNGVQVKGIVETDARKQELEAQLRPLAHVVPAIFSYHDMERQTGPASDISSVRASSVVSQPTPLENYVTGKGWSHDRFRELSYQLFDGSVTVDRESAALADLLQQFASKSQLTPEASLALGELVTNHKARLLSALQQEEHGIAEMGLSANPGTSEGSPDLITAAHRNSELMKELISASSAESRPAPSIVPELANSITQLRAVMSHLPADLRASNSSASHPAPSEQH